MWWAKTGNGSQCGHTKNRCMNARRYVFSHSCWVDTTKGNSGKMKWNKMTASMATMTCDTSRFDRASFTSNLNYRFRWTVRTISFRYDSSICSLVDLMYIARYELYVHTYARLLRTLSSSPMKRIRSHTFNNNSETATTKWTQTHSLERSLQSQRSMPSFSSLLWLHAISFGRCFAFVINQLLYHLYCNHHSQFQIRFYDDEWKWIKRIHKFRR